MLNREKPVKLVINREKCANCGKCVDICPTGYVEKEETPFGCIQCGHCMMVCPTGCLEIKGEGISKEDIISLDSLFTRRRSIRKFKKQEIPKETIEKLLEYASTAPISIPPSEVKVLVISGFQAMREFTDDMLKAFQQAQKTINPAVLWLLQPLIGKARYKIFRDFILPLIGTTLDADKQGKDILFYDAPSLILFYGAELCDREDQTLAAAHAGLAAEEMGLGTCIIGSVPPMLDKNSQLREKYGILKGEKPGIALILGYPDVKFARGIKRRFKSVNYVKKG